MKLNHDYIRDVLLYVEENLNYDDTGNHQNIWFASIPDEEKFKNHDKEQLKYAIELLVKEGYLECDRKPFISSGNLTSARIIGLSWVGHDLLDNIRNDTVWNAVKEKSKKCGKFSLKVLSDVAYKLAFTLMTNPNAIQNFSDGLSNITNMF